MHTDLNFQEQEWDHVILPPYLPQSSIWYKFGFFISGAILVATFWNLMIDIWKSL